MRALLSVISLLAAVSALPACGFSNVHETVHRTVPTTGSPAVRVRNAVGGVTINAWDKPEVDVEAVKSARSIEGLHSIAVDVATGNSGVSVTTVNNNGDFWNAGGVRYTIMVPANSSLDVSNDTGGVRIYGVRGNVTARTTTGGMQADLGRVDGRRNIDLRVTTGGIEVTIARNSNATLDLHTTVGGVSSAFPGNRIGSGSAHIHLETVTGGVALHASS